MKRLSTFWQSFRAVLKIVAWPFEPSVYVAPYTATYYSRRYDKSLTMYEGDSMDGATCCPNFGESWKFHDIGFKRGRWDDGTPMTWRQINNVMKDIMVEEEQPEWVQRLVRKGINSKYGYQVWKKRRAQDAENGARLP